MFELSVACKYLIPRWRQLSVSIISLVSTFVIALVVWLIVVFFSVKDGLENSWIQKIIALTAPIRLSPTEKYYQSYYYLADELSSNSNYSLKTIYEKWHAPNSDPYDPELDEELPREWAAADRHSDGTLKDIVKEAFQAVSALKHVKGLKVEDYETTAAHLHLKLLRPVALGQPDSIQYVDHSIYLGSFDRENQALAKTLHTTNHAESTPQEISGEPIILPKHFQEAGIVLGDSGFLSYFSPTPSSIQEQRIPIFVSGFYDPGIMPMGGKYILADRELTSLIRSSHGVDDTLFSNGINVRFDQHEQAPQIKKQLLGALKNHGIEDYWKVETYQEFDFTKDLLQQLKSEKNLFSLISLIIIIVACSNIISMLIILVNDKKTEIGILRSMGATSRSIAMIFGVCGIVMGAVGSLVGILAAVVTLFYINELAGWISRIQGYDLFNPVFYGTSLPSELSLEALSFVILTTVFISLLAGIVPAVKASLIRPSMILRAE